MPYGFHIVRKLETGEILRVAWRHDFEAAEKLVKDLIETFPAEYDIKGALGNNVDVVSQSQSTPARQQV